MKKILSLIIFSIILFPISYIVYGVFIWKLPSEKQNFLIKPGESFSSINYRLKKENVIFSSTLFYHFSKNLGYITKLQAGNHTLPPNSNMLTLLDTLTHQRPLLKKITIPEGKNLYEIGKILEEYKIVTYKDFVAAAKDQKILKALDINAPSIEGYLYPETYHLAESSNANEIINIMFQEFVSKTKDLNFTHPTLTPHEIVTLASIVEKETGAPFERDIIAGVFLNRLKKRMRLQSDPTTIYGFYEKFKGNLSKKNLRTKTAYNTYTFKGLPKGPISNPGLDAIKAVLFPQKHNYLYFVSKNDGTHQFSENYTLHRKSVNYYQKNAANRKGKSWRDLAKRSN